MISGSWRSLNCFKKRRSPYCFGITVTDHSVAIHTLDHCYEVHLTDLLDHFPSRCVKALAMHTVEAKNCLFTSTFPPGPVKLTDTVCRPNCFISSLCIKLLLATRTIAFDWILHFTLHSIYGSILSRGSNTASSSGNLTKKNFENFAIYFPVHSLFSLPALYKIVNFNILLLINYHHPILIFWFIKLIAIPKSVFPSYSVLRLSV